MKTCDHIGTVPEISEIQNRTNFTLSQLSDYFEKYVDFRCMDRFSFVIGTHCFAISGFIGLVAYCLMLISLRKLDICGSTMIYHRAIILAELPHMLTMAQYGLLSIYEMDIPNGGAYVAWLAKFYCGWVIGDTAKLIVSTLTAFLSLERCIAVCVPSKFNEINQTPVALVAVAISVFIGSAHIWPMLASEVKFDTVKSEYAAYPTAFADNFFFNFTIRFIYVTKVVLCLIIFCLCVATAINVNKQQKKMGSMSRNAKEELDARKRACAFAYVTGICVLIDHSIWVLFKITETQLKPGAMTVEDSVAFGRTFEQAINDITFARAVMVSGFTQAIMGQILHAWRFFIYLALNRSMREAFREAMPFFNNNRVITLAASR